MNKDVTMAGAVCLLIGGLLGYIVGSQVTLRQLREPSETRGGSQSANVPVSGLPEGHPGITTQADFDNLKKSVEAAPDNAALAADLANKFYDASRYEEAIVYYERALKLDPRNVNVITDYGTALYYAGKPDEALAQYNRSLQLNPRHAQSLHNLVIVYLQGKKDVAAATEALQRLKSIDPANPSIPNLEGMINQGATPAVNPRQRIF